MSDFPSVPILASAATKEYIPPEHRVCQSISHKEARDVWGSSFRRRWTINLKLLGGDIDTVTEFYRSMNGPIGTFYFMDPQGENGTGPGGAWLCRFDSETLPLSYGDAPYYWPATVSIIEVL